jgi:hypothetical protein
MKNGLVGCVVLMCALLVRRTHRGWADRGNARIVHAAVRAARRGPSPFMLTMGTWERRHCALGLASPMGELFFYSPLLTLLYLACYHSRSPAAVLRQPILLIFSLCPPPESVHLARHQSPPQKTPPLQPASRSHCCSRSRSRSRGPAAVLRQPILLILLSTEAVPPAKHRSSGYPSSPPTHRATALFSVERTARQSTRCDSIPALQTALTVFSF